MFALQSLIIKIYRTFASDPYDQNAISRMIGITGYFLMLMRQTKFKAQNFFVWLLKDFSDFHEDKQTYYRPRIFI